MLIVIRGSQVPYAVPLSLLLLIGIHDIDTNRIWRTVLLMPVFHVLPGLHRNGAATVVFLVKSWIEVMHDRSEVALQGIVVNRALTVAINAVVHVGDCCLYCPVGYVYSRVFDDLPDDLCLKGAAMREDPIGIVIRHGCSVAVLLFHHLFYHGLAIFVPW